MQESSLQPRWASTNILPKQHVSCGMGSDDFLCVPGATRKFESAVRQLNESARGTPLQRRSLMSAEGHDSDWSRPCRPHQSEYKVIREGQLHSMLTGYG
ncbi:hypothetical protein JZ751_022809, partial [Albula glossodonta]